MYVPIILNSGGKIHQYKKKMISQLKDLWGASPLLSMDALDRTHQRKKELLLQLRHCRDDLVQLQKERKSIDHRIMTLDVRRRELQRKLRESIELDRTECQRFVDSNTPPMATVVAIEKNENSIPRGEESACFSTPPSGNE